MNLLTTIISILYATTGIIAIIGYTPTIRDLLRKKRSANYHSYMIWTASSTITFLYALIVIGDLLLRLMTGLLLFLNFSIFILALRLKEKA